MSWQDRARAVGLRQSTIALMLDRSEWYVSRRLRRVPVKRDIVMAISGWELMTPPQRVDWLAALDLARIRPRQPVTVRAAASILACWTAGVPTWFAWIG